MNDVIDRMVSGAGAPVERNFGVLLETDVKATVKKSAAAGQVRDLLTKA